MELIEALGLNIKVLLAQLLNFAILFFVLYRFGYKPITGFIDERRKKIEDGIKNAEKAETKLAESKEKEKEIVLAAKREAAGIVKDAKDRAERKQKEMIEDARGEIGKLIDAEKLKIQAEKSETLKAIRKEVAGLVSLSLEKVLGKKIDAKADQELIEKALKGFK